MVHLDFDIDAFARTNEYRIERLRSWDRVPIQRNHSHLVPGKGNAAILNRAGIEEVDEQSLALADTDGLARSERLVIDRVSHGADFEAVRIGVERGRLLQ